MKIDDIDLSIMDELSKDSRLSMRELAKKVNLSAPSVAERVRKLESDGIIEGYTLKINHKKIGLTLECIIEITVKNADYNKMKEFIQNRPRVTFCYRVAGRACFFVKLNVYELKEIEDFINDVSKFTTTTTHIIFSEVPLTNDLRKFLK